MSHGSEEDLFFRLSRLLDLDLGREGKVRPLSVYAGLLAVPKEELEEAYVMQLDLREIEQENRCGPWVLVERIGSGGQAVVYRAVRPTDDPEDGLPRTAAIKIVPVGPEGSEASRRARIELAVLRRFEHASLPRFLGEGTRSGETWIAMELIAGPTLAMELEAEREHASRGRDDREPARVAGWLERTIELARCLGACHAQGIVHRDVKPENVRLREDGTPVLLDFGVARVAADDAGTRLGFQPGTPRYQPPELLRGEPASPAADVWSLGVLLYRALSGRHPFLLGGEDDPRAAILRGAPRPLRTLNPAVSAGLAAVVHRCLRKDPSARFADGAALATALAGAAALRPSLAARAIPHAALLGSQLREVPVTGWASLASFGGLLACLAVLFGGPRSAFVVDDDGIVSVRVESAEPPTGSPARELREALLDPGSDEKWARLDDGRAKGLLDGTIGTDDRVLPVAYALALADRHEAREEWQGAIDLYTAAADRLAGMGRQVPERAFLHTAFCHARKGMGFVPQEGGRPVPFDGLSTPRQLAIATEFASAFENLRRMPFHALPDLTLPSSQDELERTKEWYRWLKAGTRDYRVGPPTGDHGPSVTLVCERSAFALWRPVRIPLAEEGDVVLSWEWAISELPEHPFGAVAGAPDGRKRNHGAQVIVVLARDDAAVEDPHHFLAIHYVADTSFGADGEGLQSFVDSSGVARSWYPDFEEYAVAFFEIRIDTPNVLLECAGEVELGAWVSHSVNVSDHARALGWDPHAGSSSVFLVGVQSSSQYVPEGVENRSMVAYRDLRIETRR